MTGGRTPAPLPLRHRRHSRLEQHPAWPTLQGSSTHLNWEKPIAVITLLLSPCCYHLAFSMPRAQACAELSGEPLQMPSLEARTVIKRAGTQPQGLPAFYITPQHVTSDPTERCCSQESWLGLTLRKRQKFPVLPLLFCSCVSSFIRALSLFLLKRTLVLLI